jgi:uncharacterized membrane protein
MKLTPEERRKIYEEEKAKEEEQKRRVPPESTVNITPNITGVLCYLGIWITGIIFFILEQKNRWVRFHAAQSIVVFGVLSIANAILHWIPFIGWFFTVVIWIVGVILWILLMSKAYNGEYYKLPLAGDLAEMMLGITFSGGTPPPSPPYPPTPPTPPTPPKAARKAAPAAPAAPPPPPTAAKAVEEKPTKKKREYTEFKREGRIVASSFAIAWSVILLVVFNFLNQYIAYYTYHADTKSWSWESFFNSDINAWLPILNAALGISIIGNIILIIVNNRIVRDAVHVFTNGFNLAAVVTLLIIFPFNFNVIPNADAAGWTELGVRIGLAVIAVGFGISLLVRAIRLLVSSLRGVTASS